MENKTSLSKEEILSAINDAQVAADKASSVQECLLSMCFSSADADTDMFIRQYHITSNLAFVASDYIDEAIKILERVSGLLEGEKTA